MSFTKEQLREQMLLYAVTDRHWLNGQTLYEQVEEALKGGATFIQLREKDLTEEEFLEEAKTIVHLVGGEKNINNLVHCATRLRFELKNDAKADKTALEQLPYVMKVIVSGGQYQVVIGPEVNN